METDHKLLTIDQFLQLLPWPKDIQSKPQFQRLWHFDLAVQPEQIWPYVINSNRINKDLGYEGIEYQEIDGVLRGKSGEGRNLQVWTERPWEWNYAQFLARLRTYESGPLEYNRTAAYIERLDHSGIRLYVYIGSISSHPLANKVMEAFFNKFEKRYREIFVRYENEILGGEKRESNSDLTPQLQEKINFYFNQYEDQWVDKDLAKKILQYILTADEIDLYRIRILALATAWNVDADTLLEVCLQAVKFGILQITWDTICPHCRGPRHENPYLAAIELKGRCEVCQIEFENNGVNSIEVVFHVHPSIREIKKIFYCSSEPYTKKHIKLQHFLEENEVQEKVETLVPKDDYSCRVVGAEKVEPFVIEAVTVTKEEDHKLYDQWLLKLRNPFNAKKLFVLENKAWDDEVILKPARLFGNTLFRELFSDEYLPYDLNLELGIQTIMFVDIARSTEYYETHGDAIAFKEIRKIFVHIAQIAKQYHGAVFKTLGDGCLLVFNDAVRALQAAKALKAAIKSGIVLTDLNFRISVHAGQCLAVNFNNKIDYFGQTVNLTAKLQSNSNPGDVVISQAMFENKYVHQFIENSSIAAEAVEVTHHSLSRPIKAYLLKI